MSNKTFDDFVLVGGTALSMQLGHRKSIDIDLFTEKFYGSMNLKQILSLVLCNSRDKKVENAVLL
jgi:hypothetical protein